MQDSILKVGSLNPHVKRRTQVSPPYLVNQNWLGSWQESAFRQVTQLIFMKIKQSTVPDNGHTSDCQLSNISVLYEENLSHHNSVPTLFPQNFNLLSALRPQLLFQTSANTTWLLAATVIFLYRLKCKQFFFLLFG